MRIVQDVRPHEFYNLAAMSFVPASWDQPLLTGEFNSQGVTRVLEAIRQVDPGIRLYQASSSEMYGRVREVPQTELTPEKLAALIRSLDRAKLLEMARNARALGKPEAARVVAQRCMELAQRKAA